MSMSNFIPKYMFFFQQVRFLKIGNLGSEIHQDIRHILYRVDLLRAISMVTV